MSWMPKQLVNAHTRGGQYVGVDDAITFHNDRQVIAITVGRGITLELDVLDDSVLIEHIAEALLKVLGDARLAHKAAEVAAAKAALAREAAAA